jgi:hypothetical protein
MHCRTDETVAVMEIAQTDDIEPHYQPLIEMARGGSAK